MVVVKPVHLMPVLCPAPDAIIALQTASLQPFLTKQEFFLRYLGQSPCEYVVARNALMNKSKEQQDDGGSHVGPHAYAGLQDVILALLARRNVP